MNEEAAVYERKRFGTLLKDLRKARKLTAFQVEAKTDIHEKDIGKFERGAAYPTWGYYCKLYNFFGGENFPEYRPITAGVREIPITDNVIDELDELTKTQSITKIRKGCRIQSGQSFYSIMRGVNRCVRRKTLQNIFNYIGWGEIADDKMGEYPTK